jgi:hypothetical protein
MAALAGLGIAAVDFGLVGRRARRFGRPEALGRFGRIRALPLVPQLADHVLFGATVGAVVSVRRACREVAIA